MDTATTIRFCDLVIGLANFVELLALALPFAGLLAIGLIAASRRLNRPHDIAGRAPAKEPSRIPAPRLAKAPPHTQPKSDKALIAAA